MMIWWITEQYKHHITCYNCVKITALYKFYLILRSFEHLMNSDFYKIYKINITNQPDTNITEYYAYLMKVIARKRV